MTEAQATPTRGHRQVLQGTVVSDKMDKTIVVKVEKTVMHGLYRRYMKKSTKYYAHDEGNECGVGDRVEIVAARPTSRLKRWRLRRVLARAEGA